MIHFAEVFIDMGIVAAGKSSEQIEFLNLDKSGIKVAEYLTSDTAPGPGIIETKTP
jgi:hypothetical protein